MFENAFLLLPATVPGQYPDLLDSNQGAIKRGQLKLSLISWIRLGFPNYDQIGESTAPWPINASMNRILRDIDIGNAVRFRAEVNAAIFDAEANVGDRFQYPDDFDSHYAAISFSL